ncbi:MAG TPA: hypothetical protein VLE22_14390 [Bryobacteraceae bacterium]|nr:hypothetical protein [Bryobacteraceae bacterium]
MNSAVARLASIERYALPLCLAVQAVLLFPQLDLLPVWGDEHYTIQTASQPLSGVLETVRREVNNPPLHPILVHFWLRGPWPGSTPIKARALSVLFALAATLLLDRLWLRPLPGRCRIWYLALWCLSPYMLLYSRMARAYTLQAALFCAALWFATRLFTGQGKLGLWLGFILTSLALLYVHYLPGMAVLASVAAVFLWKAVRERKPRLLGGLMASAGLIVILYLPWLLYLQAAMGRVARAAAYSPFGESVTSHALRLAYLFFSFHFGETPPEWVVAASVVLAPLLSFCLWKAAARPPVWFALLAITAVAGYLAASRWVSFAFVPARLVFVYPFFLLLLVLGLERAGRRLRVICLTGLVCLSAASIIQYFQREGFLNKAYLMPYDEAARLIQSGTPGTDTVVIVDMYNNDPWPLVARLPDGVRVVQVAPGRSFESLRSEVATQRARTVWYFRNTHDVSPGGINRKLETELSAGRQVRSHLFLPYSRLDRWMMQLLGWPERPTHVIQMLEIRGP